MGLNFGASFAAFPLAMIFLIVIGCLAYGIVILYSKRSNSLVRWALMVAWVAHGLLAVYAMQSGRFGFGPALSVTAWLALSIYALESRWYPQLQLRRPLASLSAAAMLLGMIFPGKALHASASLWLPLHGALGLAAYGLLLIAAVHAWLMQAADQQIRLGIGTQTAQTLPIMTLERLMFAFSTVAFVLLTGTLLAGNLFSEVLYGKRDAWRWNHKTTFTILAWGVLAVVLLGRWQWGWRGRKAARWIYSGAALLALAYVGTRFVFEILLARTASAA